MNKRSDYNDFGDTELIQAYSNLLAEMKSRGIIRSKNVTGDLGEFIAVDHYRKTSGLPKLQFAPPSTKNIDAISVNGDRYSIKTISTNTTGAFYGIPKDADKNSIKPAFEYFIIVRLNGDFGLVQILEIDWDTFFELKHWHSRINAYNIIVNHELVSRARIIYSSEG